MKTYNQGDTITGSVKLAYKGNGDPVELSGCIAYSQMRKSPDDEIVAEGTPYIDVAQGMVIVEYTPQQTKNIEPGVYGYDIRLKSVWRDAVSSVGDYSINSVGQTGTDVITLFREQIQIVKSYTELE